MSMLRRFASTSALPPTIRELLTGQKTIPDTIHVNGWVKSIRRQKNVSFAVISDGSTAKGLQAVFSDAGRTSSNASLFKSLTNGTSVRLTGKLRESLGAGQAKELQVEEVQILGECNPETYPIQKQALSPEYLRDNAHLRARTDTVSSMLRIRDSTLRTLHAYFQDQGFLYTHTPILTSNDCEGAGEAFRIAPVPPPPEQEFFSRPSYLTVSSQLHLEALATSVSRVYTISPCFRAERSQTNRHLAEFWMLEAEWAFTNTVQDVCGVVETGLRDVLSKHLLAASRDDMDVLWKTGDDRKRLALENAAAGEAWTRMTYGEAIKALEGASTKGFFQFEPKWGRPLQSEHERWLAEILVGGPVFVTDYPTALKPFYMRVNDGDGGATVSCFDLLVPYVGELAGGSLREERLDKLEANMERCGLNQQEYGWYTDLRKFGGAPHGGFGMGFERLIGWLGGIENVRECIPMPRWAGRMLL